MNVRVFGVRFWVFGPGGWLAAIAAWLSVLPLAGAPNPTPITEHRTPNNPSAAEKIGDHRYRIGQVMVDTAAKVVQVPCRVNMRRGMVEFMAVASEGKLHESVLLAEAEPLHVHLALMLLGLEPGRGAQYHGDLAPPSGPSVEARVEWQAPPNRWPAAAGSAPSSPATGRWCSARLEEFAWDIPARRTMPPVAWIFTGTMLPVPGPRTEEERSVVATFRDPGAVLTNPLSTGADDSVYKANERLVPPAGTHVTLLLRPTELTKNGARKPS
jgi:hypothetical protein